jgi:hypothetical protein
MKHLRKFYEGLSMSNILAEVKEIFLNISDEFKVNYDWDSDEVELFRITINIETKEFIPSNHYNKNNFFYVLSLYGNNYQKELLENYKKVIELHENINSSISRFKELYPNISYSIEQKNTNKTEIKIEIYIYETK